MGYPVCEASDTLNGMYSIKTAKLLLRVSIFFLLTVGSETISGKDDVYATQFSFLIRLNIFRPFSFAGLSSSDFS